MTTDPPLDFPSNPLGLNPHTESHSERCIHQCQCPTGGGLAPKVNGCRDDIGARQPVDEKGLNLSMAAMHLYLG